MLVPGGGQVAFQTLDLLGVFLKDREGPEIWCLDSVSHFPFRFFWVTDLKASDVTVTDVPD